MGAVICSITPVLFHCAYVGYLHIYLGARPGKTYRGGKIPSCKICYSTRVYVTRTGLTMVAVVVVVSSVPHLLPGLVSAPVDTLPVLAAVASTPQ